ncbi:MAG: NFACT RNA binding domain-containing protein [Clostridia bacterium]|nr:NFACT RNA binding domain-containing protein [Clostridia bacterium]
MPMDGFTLSFMQRELRNTLLGGRVDKVNQPERDALVLLVRSGGNHKLLLSANANQARAQLTSQAYENPAEPPMFCMLMRKHLLGSRIVEIAQLSGDRILAITFDCLDEMGYHVKRTLYLEIMGRHSNLTLVDEEGVIIDAIRHVNAEMSRVRTVLPGGIYHLPPQPDKLTPAVLSPQALYERLSPLSCALHKGLMECVAGMAGVCSKEVCAQIGVDPSTPIPELEIKTVCQKLYDFLTRDVFAPVTLYDEAGLALDFFAFPYQTFATDRQKAMPTLSAAMDEFYLGRDLRMRMQQRSAGLQKHVKSALERTEKKKAIMLDTLQNTEQTEQNRVFGDLLTANLHLMEKGAEQVTVINYYDPECPEITIPLSGRLTPPQNAQQYYKKYRKAKVAEQYAAEQLITIERDLQVLENALEDLEKCETSTDLAEIRFVLMESGFLRPDANQRKQKGKKLQEGKPYRFTAPDGTLIEVGKNSLQNDRLTLHARGNETWLHAQNIPGSHVIIRTEEEPSEETLLYACKLATYYSKGRNHPQQAIDYTRRKYVKKAAGSPAGLVTYTNFKTAIIGLTPEDVARIMKESSK